MKKIIKLSILATVNIGIIFLFQWYVLVHIGPGKITDAFFAGMMVPQLISTIFSASMTNALVPIFTERNNESRQLNLYSLIFIVGLIFSIVCIVLWISAHWWIPIIVPGFDETTKELTIDLARIQLVGMIFTCINVIQGSDYYAQKKFISFEIILLSSNVCALGFLIWILPVFGIHAAAWILILRIIFQSLLLALGLGLPLRFNFEIKLFKLIWKRTKPMIFGTTYYMTDTIIDRFLLSTTGSGSLSLYYFAQQLYGAVSEVMNKAIANPLLLTLTKFNNINSKDLFIREIYSKLYIMIVISFIGILILVFFGKEFLSILVQYGRLTNTHLDLLWFISLLMAGRFALGNIGMVMSTILYSLGNTKLATKIGVISYSLGFIIKIILFNYYGLTGLALGVSVYYFIYVVFMAFEIKKYLKLLKF